MPRWESGGYQTTMTIWNTVHWCSLCVKSCKFNSQLGALPCLLCHDSSCPAPHCWAGHSLQSSAGGSQQLPASTVASKSFLVNGAVPVPECRRHGFRGWTSTGRKKTPGDDWIEHTPTTAGGNETNWALDQVSGKTNQPFKPRVLLQSSFLLGPRSFQQYLNSSLSPSWKIGSARTSGWRVPDFQCEIEVKTTFIYFIHFIHFVHFVHFVSLRSFLLFAAFKGLKRWSLYPTPAI